MIKRRFYREEHRERDDPSADSSSSSSSDDDSEVEAEATEESEDHAAVAEAKENDEYRSTSSGYYVSDDSSADEVDADTSEKLLKENKLKSIFKSDGEIENQETAAEMHAQIVALGQQGKGVSNMEKTKLRDQQNHQPRKGLKVRSEN